MEFNAEVELPIPQSAANLIVSGIEILKIVEDRGCLDTEVIPLLEGAKSVAKNGGPKMYQAFLMQVLNDISKNIYVVREMVRIRLEQHGENDV